MFYITKETLDRLSRKAEEKFGPNTYISLANICVVRVEEDRHLYIPHEDFKTGAPHYDATYGGYYIPTTEERRFLEDDWDDYKIPLRQKSILGEMGYSVNLSDFHRKKVLECAAEKYGRGQIVDTIQRNICLREKQKKDYSRAIRIWRNDIELVKTMNESAYLERMEIERKKKAEELAAEAEKKRTRRILCKPEYFLVGKVMIINVHTDLDNTKSELQNIKRCQDHHLASLCVCCTYISCGRVRLRIQRKLLQ